LREGAGVEIILSDGGSTDCTRDLARPHVDVVVEADGPQNIAAGRNRGARCARGDILVFLNADVRLGEPERFFRVMDGVMEDPRTVAATCNVLVNPEEERVSDRWFHHLFNLYCRLLNAAGMGMGRGECHVVRRSAFEAAGGYREEITAGEDYELFLRLRRTGAVRFVRTLTVFESPRRYRVYGYLRIASLWFLNGVSVLVRGRSMSKTWIPVR
jgi:glycosyltransferase involved in cell wall biosynthesis